MNLIFQKDILRLRVSGKKYELAARVFVAKKQQKL